MDLFYSSLFLSTLSSGPIYSTDVCTGNFLPTVDSRYLLYSSFVDAYWNTDLLNSTLPYFHSRLFHTGYLSKSKKSLRPDCIEILQTNVLAPADCALGPTCGAPLWHGLHTNWYGKELGVCFSSNHSVHPDDLYHVFIFNSSVSSGTVGILDSVQSVFPEVIFDPKTNLYAYYPPICHYQHVSFNLQFDSSPVTSYEIVERGSSVCFKAFNEIDCDLLWEDFGSVLRKINPLLVVNPVPGVDITSNVFDTKQVFCGVKTLNYSQIVAVIGDNYTYRTGPGGLFKRGALATFTFRCFPIQSHYINPASKLVSSTLHALLSVLLGLLSSIFSNLDGIVETLLDSLGTILVKVFEILCVSVVKYSAMKSLLLSGIYYAFVDESLARSCFAFLAALVGFKFVEHYWVI